MKGPVFPKYYLPKRKKRIRVSNVWVDIRNKSACEGLLFPEKLVIGAHPKISAVLRHKSKYLTYPVRAQVAVLGISDAFLGSLGQNSRVLEVGSWSGRLASKILSGSKINPKNYELLDLEYACGVPPLKHKLYYLHKKGAVSLSAGNIADYDLKPAHYDHILIPQAFFLGELIGRKGFERLRHLEKRASSAELELFALRRLVKKLAPAVRVNGSIRISAALHNNGFEGANLKRAFKNFSVEYTNHGVILTRLK